MERRLGRGILHPHPLQDAGQGVGQRAEGGQDVDHRDRTAYETLASGTRRGQLLHELEPDTARGPDEGDATGAEGPLHHRRPPDDVVPDQLGVEVVTEQGGVKEALGRKVHDVLVDGPGEQGDHDRSEERVGTLAVPPHHPVPDLRPGLFVEAAGFVEVRNLDRQIGQAGNGHGSS